MGLVDVERWPVILYSPEMVGSSIPVMTVAAPSEVVVHGGISKVFPSKSTIAERIKC